MTDDIFVIDISSPVTVLDLNADSSVIVLSNGYWILDSHYRTHDQIVTILLWLLRNHTWDDSAFWQDNSYWLDDGGIWNNHRWDDTGCWLDTDIWPSGWLLENGIWVDAGEWDDDSIWNFIYLLDGGTWHDNGYWSDNDDWPSYGTVNTNTMRLTSDGFRRITTSGDTRVLA